MMTDMCLRASPAVGVKFWLNLCIPSDRSTGHISQRDTSAKFLIIYIPKRTISGYFSWSVSLTDLSR